MAWYYKKEYEKAIKNYDIEIEMEPENHVAYFNRAFCFAALGKNKEALDDLSKTLNLKPDFHWATRYKADLLAQQEKEDTKPETYKEAVKQDPGSMYALQAGAYLNQANANNMKTKLVNSGVDSRILILKDSRGRTWYLVRSGSYANQDEARKASLSLKDKAGIDPVIRPAGTW
ncbi:SPOR domain-containing protein [Desulfobacula sp.]|uniref:SPOR domain-containing protein n=1 Tax=Desulfobacula sp. TaxID=2593537 RepID=UPI0026092A5D|nr:SPOR domain-containing protein [Desulfobacula sp.]